MLSVGDLKSLIFLPLIGCGIIPLQDFGGIAAHDAIVGHVLHDNCPCGNDAMLADCHARHHLASKTQPCLGSYDDGAFGVCPLSGNGNRYILEHMVAVGDMDVGRKEHIVLDYDFVVTANAVHLAEMHPVAYDQLRGYPGYVAVHAQLHIIIEGDLPPPI